MYATYATDYDLAVAADRLRDLRDQAKLIHVAQSVQTEAPARPSLLDRLIAITRRSAPVQARHGKVGATA